MKKYETPKIEVIMFEGEDIIATSGIDTRPHDEFPFEEWD